MTSSQHRKTVSWMVSVVLGAAAAGAAGSNAAPSGPQSIPPLSPDVKLSTGMEPLARSARGLRTRAVSGYETILNNGPSANRVDLVFVGDGYTSVNLDDGVYDRHINRFLDDLFKPYASGGINDPFPRYQNLINVHKINVVSNQEGADKPPQGLFYDTALDASYWWNGTTERLLYTDYQKTMKAYREGLAEADFSPEIRMVSVNDTKYGGGGGTFAVYAGANSQAQNVAVHELGHSFSRLADEYEYPNDLYQGAEPGQVNVTADPSGDKWKEWLGFDDPRGANLDIGVYEGARYYREGLYRPSQNSKMRSLGQHFNAVGREQVIFDIFDLVDPLDGYRDNEGWVEDSAGLWVEVVDPAVIGVQWYVDDLLVAGASGESFNPLDFGYGAGRYVVRAHAYDTAIDHAYQGGLLDLVRRNYSLLEQDVSWHYVALPEPSTRALFAISILALFAVAWVRSLRLPRVTQRLNTLTAQTARQCG